MSLRGNRSRGTAELFDRTPPHDLTAEKAVLGSIILRPEVLSDLRDLTHGDFYDPAHAVLFAGIERLRVAGKPHGDTALLLAELKADPLFQDGSSVTAFLAEIARAVPTAANAPHYAGLVRERADRRRCAALGVQLLQAAHNETPLGDVRQAASNELALIGTPRAVALLPPLVTRLADVQPQSVQWLWPQRIALGKLTLLVGNPGLGKSFITLDLAARVTLGSPWPDDQEARAPQGDVVLLTAEDGLADTVRPRLDTAGANVARIIALTAVGDPNEPQHFNLARDVPALEQAIDDATDCRLVIVDPITAYLGDKADTHNNADVRGLLAPLAALAERRQLAVLAVSHLNKSSTMPAVYRAMGSLAFVAAARAVWAVAKDAGDPSGRRRLFVPIKNNLGNDETGLAYQLSAQWGRNGQPIVAWEPDPVTIPADQAMGDDRRGTEPEREERAEAVDWLREVLAHGAVAAGDVKKRAKADGISPRTLDRAKAELGVVAAPEGFRGPWVWRLPDQSAPDSAECAIPESVAHCAKSGAELAHSGDEADNGEVVEWVA